MWPHANSRSSQIQRSLVASTEESHRARLATGTSTLIQGVIQRRRNNILMEDRLRSCLMAVVMPRDARRNNRWLSKWSLSTVMTALLQMLGQNTRTDSTISRRHTRPDRLAVLLASKARARCRMASSAGIPIPWAFPSRQGREEPRPLKGDSTHSATKVTPISVLETATSTLLRPATSRLAEDVLLATD